MSDTLGRVLIAGAGIGGLALAVALRRRGVDVEVFERAQELGPVGAGITVQANAMRALAHLGLASAVVAEGAEVRRAAILAPSGAGLGEEVDFGTLDTQLGQSSVAIHRARLHRVLLDALGDGVVRTGAAVTGYEENGSEVMVCLENGERREGALLVGADGLRSAVRAQLVGDVEPVYAGYTSWRAVTPAGAVPIPSRVSETWGRGARFGIVPIGHGEVYWFAVANAPAGGRDPDVRRALLARFDEWHDPICSLIEATPVERILRTDITDRPPLRRWHSGRVVLLGDAAHPMTPNLGQGGCQAIEDAVVLDACLASGKSLSSALALYQQRRAARVNSIVLAARRLGTVAQWEHPFACWARDTAMRLTPARVALRQARSLMAFSL